MLAFYLAFMLRSAGQVVAEMTLQCLQNENKYDATTTATTATTATGHNAAATRRQLGYMLHIKAATRRGPMLPRLDSARLSATRPHSVATFCFVCFSDFAAKRNADNDFALFAFYFFISSFFTSYPLSSHTLSLCLVFFLFLCCVCSVFYKSHFKRICVPVKMLMFHKTLRIECVPACARVCELCSISIMIDFSLFYFWLLLICAAAAAWELKCKIYTISRRIELPAHPTE